MDFPIKHGGSFHCYVNVYQWVSHGQILQTSDFAAQKPLLSGLCAKAALPERGKFGTAGPQLETIYERYYLAWSTYKKRLNMAIDSGFTH